MATNPATKFSKLYCLTPRACGRADGLSQDERKPFARSECFGPARRSTLGGFGLIFDESQALSSLPIRVFRPCCLSPRPNRPPAGFPKIWLWPLRAQRILGVFRAPKSLKRALGLRFLTRPTTNRSRPTFQGLARSSARCSQRFLRPMSADQFRN